MMSRSPGGPVIPSWMDTGSEAGSVPAPLVAVT
jgi:hypothetical protein